MPRLSEFSLRDEEEFLRLIDADYVMPHVSDDGPVSQQFEMLCDGWDA